MLIDPTYLLSPRPLFFFEKWYFDGQTDDGGFFLAYLAPMTLCGVGGAELVVCLFPPGGGQVRCSQHVRARDLQLDPGRLWARFPGGGLRLDADGCDLQVSSGGVELAVRYTPLDAAYCPADGGLMASQSGRSLRWVVPVPRARVDGTVRVQGVVLKLQGGLGYSDFVQTDIPPWSLPVRELLWGRALGPDRAVIWNRLGLRDGRGVTRTCRWLWRDDHGPRQADALSVSFQREVDHPRTRDRYPTELTLRFEGDGGEARDLALGQTRLLLGDFVADVQRFSTEVERELYRAATGNPVEYKLLSAVDGGGGATWAAHEWVLWGRGR